MNQRVVLLLLSLSLVRKVDTLTQPQSSTSQPTPLWVRGVPVHRVPLRQNGPQSSSVAFPSPYCLAVSSIANLPFNYNFLATQVWPSARVAARALETYGSHLSFTKLTTVCELGCGPGLPSLTAAATLQYCQQVIATDIDELALQLLTEAAKEQGLQSKVTARFYDLISAEWDNEWMDTVNLFVMSDVFESEFIAKGAAKLTKHILEQSNCKSKVWVFAQSDRAQREVYLQELRKIFPDHSTIQRGWSAFELYNSTERLWLCDVDETTVKYG